MAEGRVLVVEDDKQIAKLLKYNLEKAGYECSVSHKGEDALAIVQKQPVDLVILDIMLPGIDGLEVCKRIKSDEKLGAIPVVMLTAKGEEIDRVLGFELGADDYVVKPFSPRELILRIKAVLKRGKVQENRDDIVAADRIVIDVPRHKVFVNKKEVEFTLMEFKLLLTLIKRRGRVQSREELLDGVWDVASDVTTRTIDTHVKRLREKLGRQCGRLIETVRGIGYRFKEGDED